ncbi:DUF4153 domain-containing protein [Aliishimia ponticola]|nr:DUF4173 domain-containing protein [Aliishimia ponticola]
MKSYLVRGVPLRLQQDGWWLSAPVAEPAGPPVDTGRQGWLGESHLPNLALLVALVALADQLVWNVAPGLSLAVFVAVCIAAAAELLPGRIPARRRFLAAAIALIACLPVIELVQPLSLLFYFAGLPLALMALTGRRLRGAFRFWWLAPIFSCSDAAQAVRAPEAAQDMAGRARSALMGWALPLGVGIVFCGLLLSANPVLDQWARGVLDWSPQAPDLRRMVLWFCLALCIWPLVNLARFAPQLSPDPKPAKFGPVRVPGIINGGAIARSLILFNGLFALQNTLDVAVLAAGIGLPDGMSYAEYAHRGAYPLVILALLSGGFALLARPFITAAPFLRYLLLIWVAQTVWLTCSSLLRLDLYVETYGLTRMRMAAAIWMGLVAAGLALTLWQILRGQSNLWLLQRSAALGAGVVWLCCFVSFDRAIAHYNLTHDVQQDWRYLCRLGDGARLPVLVHTGRSLADTCGLHHPLAGPISAPADWREWGFRNARLRRSLATFEAEMATDVRSSDPHY